MARIDIRTKVGKSRNVQVQTKNNFLKGDTGNGISLIMKTNTVGLVDTYTVYFTDGTTTTFSVTNGQNGINGIDGTNRT